MGIGDPTLDAALKKDPETALPLIIGARLPQGLVGFMLAALLSGFLATFSSTVNGGAAYLVKDIYQRYLNPRASSTSLIRASYVASALLIATGLVLARFGTSINTAFMWIFGTLAAGILPPNVLRWYWWRLNGWGYAAGVFGGMLLSLGQVIGDQFVWRAATPLYLGFPIIALASTIITMVVSWLTPPGEMSVLGQFYRTVQPAGAWGPVRASLAATDAPFRKEESFVRDALNTALAVIGISGLYVGSLYLITHRYGAMTVCWIATAGSATALFFTWYRHLPPPAAASENEDITSTTPHG
jgi:Na+/proline symporter